MMAWSGIFLSSLPAERAVKARAAEAVDDGIPEKSFACIALSPAKFRGSSSFMSDSLARHFLSRRRHRSHASPAEVHVHYKQ